MSFSKSASAILLTVSLLFTAGCSIPSVTNDDPKNSDSQKTITLGVQEGNTYNNDFFGLTLEVPEGWTIANEDEMAALMQAGEQAIVENNEALAEKMDLAKEKTLNLMFAFRHPLDYQEGFNPNVLLMVENLGLLGSIAVKTGEDYLDITKTSMEEADMGYTFADVTKEKVGNRDFDMMEATLNLDTFVITQKYYATVLNGYALVFINTFSSEDEAKETQGLLNTINFE